jgi:hypothetical protein
MSQMQLVNGTFLHRLLWALIYGAENGVLEVLDVDDVSGGALVSGGTSHLLLIELVIEKEVGHLLVCEPSLVSVGDTVVGSAGDGDRHGAAGDINDGERILVVVEANLSALVLLLRTSVDHALCVVNVAIVRHAARVLGTCWVGDIDHPQSGAALEAAGGTDSKDGVGLLVGDDVVAAAEASEVGRKARKRECHGISRVHRQQLAPVKNLETMVGGLRTDVEEVANGLHVAP